MTSGSSGEWRLFFAAIGLISLTFLYVSAAAAQSVAVPNFWDPQNRPERPDLANQRVIRFTTEDDYPPFGFSQPDGTLTGFNVDLARAICEDLRVACTVQPRRWDTIVGALEKGDTDAAIASISLNQANRTRVDFTSPYYKTPARFVARKGVDIEPGADTLSGRTVGVEARTSHEAYLRTFFPGAQIRLYETPAALRSALKRGEIDIAFGDGISLSIWLNGTDSGDCCAFRGGPYVDSSYFGEGVGIAVRKGNAPLRRALDYALRHLAERGVYADIYLKYFPIGFF
jgi:polar amino acid transport system substrate-binding protein